MIIARKDRTVVRLHRRRTLERNVGARPQDTLETISLYLTLDPRPRRGWVRVFERRIAGVDVGVPDNYELVGGTPSSRRTASGRRTGMLRWLPRMLYRRPTHLLVRNCDPDPDAVRAVIEQVQGVVDAVDAAVSRLSNDRASRHLHRETARRQLERLLAESEAGLSRLERRPRRESTPLEEGAFAR
jgi:hypothetical protein